MTRTTSRSPAPARPRRSKFKAAPDYENPRGAEMSDTNTNTYMVTVMGTVKDAKTAMT